MARQFVIVTVAGEDYEITSLLPQLTALLQNQQPLTFSYSIEVGHQLSPEDPIEVLDLKTKGLVLNLHRGGINTIAELCKYSEEGLHWIEGANIGPKGTREIVEKLALQGMSLGTYNPWEARSEQYRKDHPSPAFPVTTDTPLQVFYDLPTRACNTLLREGYQTVGNLTEDSEEVLYAISGIGVRSVKSIKVALSKHGLALAEKK